MQALYKSILFDLPTLGISKLSRYMVSAEIDDGIDIFISFDSGKSYEKATPNLTLEKNILNPCIITKIVFADNTTTRYRIKVVNYFPNLLIGTTVYYKNKLTKEQYVTTIGEYGYNIILLPRGVYSIYYLNDKKKQIELTDSFVPDSTIHTTDEQFITKETKIGLLASNVEWIDVVLFDTFENDSKTDKTSTTKIIHGNLHDGYSDKKCKYWALAIGL